GAVAPGLSILTGVIFGLGPALRAAAPDLISTMNRAGRGVSGGTGSRRFRSALIVAEVALALMLLVGAGLTIRSFARLMAVDTGFDPEGVVTMRVALPASKYGDLDKWTVFHAELVRRVESIPGVA